MRVAWKTLKGSDESVESGPDACIFSNATLDAQDDQSYTCSVSAETFDGDDGVHAAYVFSKSSLIKTSGKSLSESSIQDKTTREALADETLYATVLPRVCGRVITGQCPEVATLDGDTGSMGSCPAFMMAGTNTGTLGTLQDLCSDYFRKVMGSTNVDFKFQSQTISSAFQSLNGRAVSNVNVNNDPLSLSVSYSKFRPELDDAMRAFCANQPGRSPDSLGIGSQSDDDTGIHPLCLCINRTQIPTYQLMRATSNGPDGCWWVPCENPLDGKTMVPSDVRVDDPSTCPQVNCNELVDMQDLYGSTVTIGNIAMSTTCGLESLKKISCDAKASDAAGGDAAAAAAAAAACPSDASGLETCAKGVPNVRVIAAQCDNASEGFGRWICEQWHASVFSQVGLIAVPIMILIIIFLGLKVMWASGETTSPFASSLTLDRIGADASS